mmetsp:Transcript_836/g.941  ORF Transcript_836/g.941 Transcript_836/m.941 type:complete len:157 (+) Transcript_836:222-692(+)
MTSSDLTFVNNQPRRSSGVDVSSTDLKNSWERFCSVNESTWMTVSLNSTVVELEGVGSSNIIEAIKTFSEEKVTFGAFKVIINNTIKFYNFFYVGNKVSAMKKGKAMMSKNVVFSIFSGCHGEVLFNNEDDLGISRDYVLCQIATLTGVSVNNIKM